MNMARYHVTLMKLIDLEVEATDKVEARAKAIQEHSDGMHNEAWEKGGVMIHHIEKFSDEDDV